MTEERRHDKDAEEIEDAAPSKRESLSDMLDKKRADALRAEAEAERADKLGEIDERLNRPLTARDLQHKLGGDAPSTIDKFFTESD